MNFVYKRYIKRIMDCSGAVILLVALSPFMLIIALITALDSKGPVLFRQQRVGKNEKVFTIYKFRTMCIEETKDGVPIPEMTRITRSGRIIRRLSLDELPQFFNILRGEMSFIGPRPLLIQYLPLYSNFQLRRHEVLPGITGWAQVNGRNAISWDEKFGYDVWYVDHVSFFTDLKIVGKTIIYIFFARNINQSKGATMEEFKGTDNTVNASSSKYESEP